MGCVSAVNTAGEPVPKTGSEETITQLLQKPFQQTHFNPLASAPNGWPLDGKFFPLGPNSKAKSDWHLFWAQVLVFKQVLFAACALPVPAGSPKNAPDVVQAMCDNLCTHVLATVYCPAWARSWARMLLSLIVENASTCNLVALLAVKGGPACDEECAFVRCLLLELGFEEDAFVSNIGNYSLFGEWVLRDQSGSSKREYHIALMQFPDLTKAAHMHREFAPGKEYSAAPDLIRYAVISCAEKWFINGKAMRINPEESDDNHPDGMTVNDKLNNLLVAALKMAKDRAVTKGFMPVDEEGSRCEIYGSADDENVAKACAYFDCDPMPLFRDGNDSRAAA